MSFFYNIWVSHSSFFLVFLHRSQFSGYLSVLKQLLKVYIFTFFKSDIGNLYLKMCALKKKKPKKSALVSSLRNVNSAKEGKWELCFPKLIAVRNCQWTNGQSGWKTDRKSDTQTDQVETHRWSQPVPPNDRVTRMENKEGEVKEKHCHSRPQTLTPPHSLLASSQLPSALPSLLKCSLFRIWAPFVSLRLVSCHLLIAVTSTALICTRPTLFLLYLLLSVLLLRSLSLSLCPSECFPSHFPSHLSGLDLVLSGWSRQSLLRS